MGKMFYARLFGNDYGAFQATIFRKDVTSNQY